MFWFLKTILLYIVWELAGGGSVAVSVGVNYMWQVKCNTRYMTHDTGYFKSDTWPMKHDTGHLTPYTWNLILKRVNCIGATILTRQVTRCLPYVFFFFFFFSLFSVSVFVFSKFSIYSILGFFLYCIHYVFKILHSLYIN